jgi:aspartate beta-hydroxylase
MRFAGLILLTACSNSHAFMIRPQSSVSSPIRLNMVSASSSSTDELPATKPLHPHTFAGMVEQGIVERFGETEAQRVVESWRLLEMDYEHREFVGNSDDVDPSSSMCHQHAHSYVPGLSAKPFYDTNDYEWCGKLAKKYKELKREFTKVTSDMAKLTEEGNNIWAGALTDDASSYGTGWRTLVLMDRGIWDPVNVNLFPKAAKAVKDSGAPVVEVFFASMQPNSDIQPHSDFTNFVVTSHLALDIPESGNNKCRLTIGDETRQWINGEVLMFDTSIMHDAINESDQTRYILMLRLWHPELTQVEREALQFIYDCLALPDLVSPTPEDRASAEIQLQAYKEFPQLERNGAGGGFGGAAGGGAKKGGKKQKGRGK